MYIHHDCDQCCVCYVLHDLGLLPADILQDRFIGRALEYDELCLILAVRWH